MKAKTLFVLAAVLTVSADKPKGDAKKDLDHLQGTWVMAELEVNGERVPDKKLNDTTLTIRGDKYITKVKGKSFEVTIKLDPSQKPKAIDMYFPDGPNLPKLSKGVYDLDGDTFRVCRHQRPGKDRPTQIGSWANTNLFVVTWKRKKP